MPLLQKQKMAAVYQWNSFKTKITFYFFPNVNYCQSTQNGEVRYRPRWTCLLMTLSSCFRTTMLSVWVSSLCGRSAALGGHVVLGVCTSLHSTGRYWPLVLQRNTGRLTDIISVVQQRCIKPVIQSQLTQLLTCPNTLEFEWWFAHIHSYSMLRLVSTRRVTVCRYTVLQCNSASYPQQDEKWVLAVLCSWDGNCRSGIVPVCHGLCGISVYGLFFKTTWISLHQ